MVRCKIYIEGGGSNNKSLDTLFRQGWNQFFAKAGIKIRVVRGASRQATFKDFAIAIKNAGKDELPLLLLDSECAVDPSHTVWQHLKRHDSMNKPPNARDDQAYLMVELMETWLLCDAGALEQHFGKNFKANKLPKWPDFEAIDKPKIQDTIKTVTSGQYAKGEVSFKLLALTDPEKVTEKCPNARRLIDFLSTNATTPV